MTNFCIQTGTQQYNINDKNVCVCVYVLLLEKNGSYMYNDIDMNWLERLEHTIIIKIIIKQEGSQEKNVN